MVSFPYVLTDPMGLHARPAGQLVKEAKQYSSKITLTFGASTADAARMMAVMRLGTKGGDTVTVTVEGEDEALAAEAIRTFLKENV